MVKLCYVVMLSDSRFDGYQIDCVCNTEDLAKEHLYERVFTLIERLTADEKGLENTNSVTKVTHKEIENGHGCSIDVLCHTPDRDYSYRVWYVVNNFYE